MVETYNDYVVKVVYKTITKASSFVDMLQQGNFSARLEQVELDILNMYIDLLYYLYGRSDFVTQTELINICSFINRFCGTKDTINITTIP